MTHNHADLNRPRSPLVSEHKEMDLLHIDAERVQGSEGEKETE